MHNPKTIKSLIFKNDDDHEAFYEAYNYEPDEQSKEVQEKREAHVDATDE